MGESLPGSTGWARRYRYIAQEQMGHGQVIPQELGVAGPITGMLLAIIYVAEIDMLAGSSQGVQRVHRGNNIGAEQAVISCCIHPERFANGVLLVNLNKVSIVAIESENCSAIAFGNWSAGIFAAAKK
ncbi:hypothetical protein [Hymenobacter sp. B1770]|uniref:hypothetical protein n=1 Tax=Hymenobacter sp. B1770 TaxID=1718788 RepID=UPI003CF2A77E